MERYIALLRGVNIGGNILKMERLREVWSELGFKNVETYVQSGNIVFDADKASSSWAQAAEQRLARETRLPVTVILRTPAEWKKIITLNPFLKEKGIDRKRLHVTFLGSPAKDALARLSAIKAGADRFQLGVKEIYLHCPNGYGESKLANNVLERVLAVRATTRNWNTVEKLLEMATS